MTSIFNIIDRIYIYAYNKYGDFKDSELYNFMYWCWNGKLTENDAKKIERSNPRRCVMPRKNIFNYVNPKNTICMEAFEGVDDRFRARQKDFPLWGIGPSNTKIEVRDYVCVGMASKRIGIFRIEHINYVNSMRWHGRASWIGYYTIRNLEKYIDDEIW